MAIQKLDTNGKLTLTTLIIAIFQTALIGFVSWMFLQIDDLQAFADDGPRWNEDQARAQAATLRLEIAKLELSMKAWVREVALKGYPPAPLLKDVENNARRIEKLEERVR